MDWKDLGSWLFRHRGRSAAQANGPLLQFDQQRSKKPVSAIIGLDFGTSCTKAAIRLPFAHVSRAHFVPLGDGSATPYFCRSGLGTARSNLKVRLMVDPSSEEARAHAAMHIASVARACRAWFISTQKAVYGQYSLRWELNVGMPSSGFESDRLEHGFMAAARAGWVLSHRSERNMDHAFEALANDDVGDLPVAVIPEVAAAAEGYRRSAFAQPGIHAMVDVGASTLDVCAFILTHGHDGGPFGLAIPEVAQLGSAVLHDARVCSIEQSVRGEACSLDARDHTCVVPDALDDYVLDGASKPDSLLRADESFQEECESVMRRVLGGMFMCNPLGDYSVLPLFLTGGGGSMRFYRRTIEHMKATKGSAAWARGLEVRVLDRPDDVVPKSIARRDVPRLMVAYGLSHPRPDFGTFVSPSSCDSIEPPPRRRLDDLYVGKDLV